MKVGRLTIEQKNELDGKFFSTDSYFNPVLDGSDPVNWVISTQEIEQCINDEFIWVKDLPLIEWVPPTYSITPIK